MGRPVQKLQRFLHELRRRNVYRVAATYAVVAFVGFQAAKLLIPSTVLPAWTDEFFLFLLIIGFPVAVVVAWAFELTPEGVRRTAETEPEGSFREGTDADPRTRTAYLLLLGFGLVSAALAGGWYLTGGGGGESPEAGGGTVAVLPFQVSGAGAETWRDGMVTMLTPGLDGAGGLRAIPDRTVFAAWGERTREGRGVSSEEALSVAREVGAEYAVVGSAVRLGSGLQLTVDVRDTRSGDQLGRVEVRGSPDSVMTLADGLTRQVLEVLLEESERGLPSVDLASLTTSSLPALKSYLRGERHFRDAKYESAINDYEAAIKQDSSFAMAYTQLSLPNWGAGAGGRLRQEALRRAYELSDRLPRRQRRLVRARYIRTVEGLPLVAADSLRRLTEAYSDDPWVWYFLAETVHHGTIPRGKPEADEAFQKAARLDPGNISYHHHLVELAISLHQDSALAARRIEAMPQNPYKRVYRLGLGLVFGSPEQRQRVLAQIDTISISGPFLGSALVGVLLAPRNLDLRNAVGRRLLEREDLSDNPYERDVFISDLMRGRIQQALADLERVEISPGTTACFLARAMTLDMPVPDTVSRIYLAPENLPDDPSVYRLHCTGLYLLLVGRAEELDGWIGRMRAKADTTGTGSVSAGELAAMVAELQGYRAWRAGELERAARLLDCSNESGGAGAIWRGDVLRELGRLDEAEGWYLAIWVAPPAQERLGQLYEEMDRPEEAASAYRQFIAAWKDADEELQPRVEAARERLEKLTAGGG